MVWVECVGSYVAGCDCVYLDASRLKLGFQPFEMVIYLFRFPPCIREDRVIEMEFALYRHQRNGCGLHAGAKRKNLEFWLLHFVSLYL